MSLATWPAVSESAATGLMTILSTWMLALSASNAAEMFAAVSETATLACVVPSALKSSLSTAVSAAACAAVMVTSLLPLSLTMTLTTWALPLSELTAEEMFAAVSVTMNETELVSALTTLESAVASLVNCAMERLIAALSLSVIEVICELAWRASRWAPILAPVSDTLKVTGLRLLFVTSASAPASLAICAAVSVMLKLLETTIEVMVVRCASMTSRAEARWAAVSLTVTWAAVALALISSSTAAGLFVT